MGCLAVLRNPTRGAIVTRSATVLLARGVFETEIFAWYLAPAAVLLVLAVASNPAGRRSTSAFGYLAALTIYGTSFGAYFNGGPGGMYDHGFYLPAWTALGMLLLAGAIGGASATLQPSPGLLRSDPGPRRAGLSGSAGATLETL